MKLKKYARDIMIGIEVVEESFRENNFPGACFMAINEPVWADKKNA
jgi:hypothetical protein